MDTNVTKHAIRRYRERLFDYKSSNEKIQKTLVEIASHGKRIHLRPDSLGRCYEVDYKGISIVLVFDNEHSATVVTCLGSDKYRKWVKHQDIRKIPGRILYLEPFLPV